MQPHMTNIWKPISGNSNEDFGRKLDYGYMLYYVWKAWYTQDQCIQSTVDGVANPTHAWTVIEGLLFCRGRAGPVIITVLKTRALGAILIICQDSILLFFFGLHNRLWVSVGPSLIRLRVPEWANLTPDWPQSAVHAKRVCDTRE